MSWWNNDAPEEIIGKVLKDYQTNETNDELTLTFEEGSSCKFYHEQDCCESIEILSSTLELEFLRLHIGETITGFSQETPDIKPEEIFDKDDLEWVDSYTVTDLVFIFDKDTVVVRWLGQSNGYYSEGVDFTWL